MLNNLKNILIKKYLYTFNYNLAIEKTTYKLVRIKWQIKYLFNNWLYSTNHKRISINYF